MEDNMQAVIDAARQGVTAIKLETVGKFAYYLVPNSDGGKIEAINLEDGEGVPDRKRGSVQVFDAASFNALLEANKGAGDITIYIDRNPNRPSIVAVLNGHGETGAGWGDFRVEIAFRATPQWLKWKSISGRLLSQLEFAEFVEENLTDVVSPPGAEMMEIAQDLSVKRDVSFKSSVRLQDGRFQLQNIEDIAASVGAGQIAIPPTITLGLAPVFGLPPFKIDARLRYRVEGGKLKLGIVLQRVEDVMAAVVNDMVVGTVASEGRPAVVGIVAPEGAVMVEGLAPAAVK